ncbi:MAG: tetratricopeptide (TPR) repeat protein [Chlamydiales bacterium]|jgi:tetratricopeptide (TPR) repeat protein
MNKRSMKPFLVFFILFFFVIPALVMSAEELNKSRILKVVNDLARQHDRLSDEIEKLKRLLGAHSELDGLKVLEARAGMPERLRIRLEDGIKAFNEGDFIQAKEDFYLAWENDSDSYITNFNLGLAYYRLDQIPLAKRMFKVALEGNSKMPESDKIKDYLAGGVSERISTEKLSKEEQVLHTELVNLKNEADSYIKASNLTSSAKMKASVATMKNMLLKAESSKKLVEEFYLPVAEVFSAYEMFDEAFAVFEKYEKSMSGKVLPADYHAKKLYAEEKLSEQRKVLEGYKNNEPDLAIRQTLTRDLHELGIFKAQLEEFVTEAGTGDEDFDKICQRLREYRWGNKSGRHVIVVNRFQELLYSSLPGTLPLYRYKDEKGRAFLKDITMIPKDLNGEDAKFFPVDLNVNGKIIPYVVMYAYAPKHGAFIIVRLPRADLS